MLNSGFGNIMDNHVYINYLITDVELLIKFKFPLRSRPFGFVNRV